MRAGPLDKRVTLQSPGGAGDAYGERSTTWTVVATVWASITPLSARELMAGGQLQGEITHRIQLRYSSTTASITADWRVVYGSRVFVLAAPPRNVNESNDMLELLCSEGLRQE